MTKQKIQGDYGPSLGSEIIDAGLAGPMIAWSNAELRYEDEVDKNGSTAEQITVLMDVIADHDHTIPAPPNPAEVKAQEIKTYADSFNKLNTTDQKLEVDKQEFQNFIGNINDLSVAQIATIDKV